MLVVFPEQARDGDEERVDDNCSHDREEGDAPKHGQQSQTSNTQQQHLEENKTYCRYNNGHNSKSEENSNGQRGHGYEEQQRESQERVALQVPANPCAHHLGYLGVITKAVQQG